MNNTNNLLWIEKYINEFNTISSNNNEDISKRDLKKKMSNKNLLNNQNYIIDSKKIKTISKKIYKLYYYWFIEEWKRISSFWIIKKINVPFFTNYILFFWVFLFFVILLWYLLITEFTTGIFFSFLFILFWWFLMFIIPILSKKMNIKIIFDKDKYLYYFHKN